MLSLLAGTLLAVSPPVLPEEPTGPSIEVATSIEAASPVESASPGEDLGAAFVVAPAPVAPVVIAPVAVVPAPAAVVPAPVVLVSVAPPPAMATKFQRQVIARPPWSGTGRFVGGSVFIVAGLGLLTAATLEFADGSDTTAPFVSHVPAGVAAVIAGSIMIATGVRDQHRLGEWEAATKIDARPSGNGLIIGGVATVALGTMAAVATSIASELDLDAPRSIPAGWATAGVAIGAGTAMLIAGLVRRGRYGAWRDRVTGTPVIAPIRSGATIGMHAKF